MKRILIGILCLSLLYCGNSGEQTNAQAEPTGAQQEMATFGKGLVALPLEKSDHVVIRLMFRAGSINDPEDKKGLTNLTAQIVADGGNAQYAKKEIDALLYPMAVNINVFTDKEATTFSTTIHRDNLAKAYEIFRGLLLEPRFDPADFERVKKNTLNAVTKDIPNNNDEVLSKRALDGLLFAGHPYADLVEGTESGLNNITLEDVKAHYGKLFTRQNLMLGLAGGYDAAFSERFVKDMSQFPEGGDNATPLPAVAMPDGVSVRIVSKQQAFGSAIYMGYPLAIDRSSDDFAALLVAASYLGEHRKSYGRLYKNMRTARSLNYGDYAYVEWYQSGHAVQLPLTGTPRRQNFFSIWIRPVQIADQFTGIEGLEPPKLGNGHFVIRQAIRELDMLLKNGMADADFQRTRKFLMGYMKLYIQSAGDRLGFLMDSRFYGRDDYIAEMNELLAGLTLEDVNAAMKKYLQAENFYVAVITDDSEAETLAESLRSNGDASIVYKPAVRNGLPAEILEEDKEINAYKLNVTKAEVIKNDTLFR